MLCKHEASVHSPVPMLKKKKPDVAICASMAPVLCGAETGGSLEVVGCQSSWSSDRLCLKGIRQHIGL